MNFLKSKIIRNIGIYSIGNFVQKSAEFFLLPILARYLTPTDYGVIGVITSYTGFFLPIFTIGLQSYITYMFYKVQSKDEKNALITNVVIIQILLSLSLSLVLFVLGRKFWEILISKEIVFFPFAILMILITFFESINAIPMAIYRIRHQAKLYIGMQLITFSINMVLAIIFVIFLEYGAYGKLLAIFISYLITGLINSIIIFKEYFSTKINQIFIKNGLSYGLPLIPHNISGWILNASDKIILNKFVSIEEVGFYSLGYSLGLIMNVLINSINFAWMPHYFEVMNKHQEPEKVIIQELNINFLITGFICFLGILFQFDIIYFLLPDIYLKSSNFVPLILLGYFFVGINKFGSAPLFYYGKTKVVGITTIFVSSISIFLNLLFIPIYGALSSAFITAITYLLLSIFSFVQSRKWQKIEYPFKKYFLYVSMLFLTYGLCFHLNSIKISSYIGKSILFIFFVFISKLIFNDEIKKVSINY